MRLSLKNFAFVVMMAFILQGCGTSRTLVHAPVLIERIHSFNIVPATHTAKMELEYVKHFEQVIRKKLAGELNLPQGKDLTIVYKIIQFDEGSRLKRYMLGGIGNWGEGSMTVEFIFLNREGIEIGKIHTEGKIGSGFLGGSIDHAIESSAEALVEYVKSLL